MRTAIYAGSFDPVTLGHYDIIVRASRLFDNLLVAVLENPNKCSLFTIEERKRHLELVTKDLVNVEVESFQGLLADFAKDKGVTVLVRGLRNTVDFAAEHQMYLINSKLGDRLETVFLGAGEEDFCISSTHVKEVAMFGGNIDFMVPKEIEPYIVEKYKK